MTRLEFLEVEIPRLSKLYYEGNKEISDEDFDKLINELKELDPNHKLLTTTGWGYKPSGKNRVNHELTPITGISTKIRDVYYFDKLSSLSSEYSITPKYDGGSVVIYYKNGELSKAISRGDGVSGIDITNTIKQLNCVPNKISYDRLVIRGEVIIPMNNTMGIVNVRNVAVGFSQRVDYELNDTEKSELLFIPYAILSEVSKDKLSEINKLTELGFIKSPISICSFQTLKLFINNQVSSNYKDFTKLVVNDKEYEIPIDGLVIEGNTPTSREGGENSIYSRNRIAWKIDTESSTTKVRGISWESSSTGKFTPILRIDPIQIDGTTISKVTGNSYSFLTSNKCGVGSSISVIKSGGVIPKLNEVFSESEDYEIPENCPMCNNSLRVDGAHLYCTNNVCDGKLQDIIGRLFEFYRFKGFGYSQFVELAKYFKICEETDEVKVKLGKWGLFLDKLDQSVIDSLADAPITKNRKELWSTYLTKILTTKLTDRDLIVLCNIPGVGGEAIESLDKYLKDNSISFKILIDEIMDRAQSLPVNITTKNNLVKYKIKISLVMELFSKFIK